MKVKYKIDHNSKTKNRTKRTLHNFWDDEKSFFRAYQDDLKLTMYQKLKIGKFNFPFVSKYCATISIYYVNNTG